MIPFAIGTGARKSEQLSLKVRQVDFLRSLIVFDKTKSGRSQVVEMNSEVRQILLDLCKGKRPDGVQCLRHRQIHGPRRHLNKSALRPESSGRC